MVGKKVTVTFDDYVHVPLEVQAVSAGLRVARPLFT